MPRLAIQVPIYIVLLAALVLISLVTSSHFYRSYVGGQIVRQGESWVITDPPWGSLTHVEGITRGSQVVTVNGESAEDFAAGSSLIPSRKVHSVTIKDISGGEKTISDATGSVPWQTKASAMAQGLLAFMFWLAALIVWTRKPRLSIARLFAIWSLVHALIIISIMGSQYELSGMVLLRTLGYIFGPALFLHLFLSFPRRLLPSRRSFIVYLPALILVLIYGLWARDEVTFNTWFKQIVFLYLLVGYFAGVIVCAYSYFTSSYERHKLQIRLVLASACLALLLFLGLSLLPSIISGNPKVPPELTVLGTGVIPVAFAYVVVREKLPTFTRSKSAVDSRAEAASITAFATLTGDLETLSAYFVENVAQKLGVSDACLLMNDEQGLRVASARGRWADDKAEQAQLLMWASSVSDNETFPNLAPANSGCKLFVPLQSRGELVGMLCLGDKTSGGSFKERDIDLLSEVRKSIVIPLHNALLLDKVGETKESLTRSLEQTRLYAKDLEGVQASLEKSYLDAGKTIVLLLESRDPYTRGHCERVGRICRNIAQELKFSSGEMETIHLAAMFHDIGKVSVPDSILLKPGPLDPQEKAQIELHPTKSVEILRFMSFMEKALPIIEAHHEAWNGSGYPIGLKGEQIPLGARILAVADAYDAMTSARPYRPAFSTGEAVQRLEKGAGVLWDPRVVEAFFKAMVGTNGDATIGAP